jgi:AraC-like DNA-binding protein
MKNESKPSYFLVNDENLPTFGPQFGNRIIHSKLTHIEKKRVQADLSLKAVIRGKEMYRLDGQTYEVSAGQFLLVNKSQEVDCWFQSAEVTEGMCVYLDPELVSQAYVSHRMGDRPLLDDPLQEALPRNVEFLDARYQLGQNEAGRALQMLASHLPKTPADWQGGDPQLFVWLADQLVQSQQGFLSQANNLKAEKASTRKELYRRLLIAKEMIDARFREDIDLEEISRASALSLYHMLRNFREAFGVTPHQYLMHRRLEYARQLLQRGGLRITDIAKQSGFGDLHNFGKAFRKRYGTSPRTFVREAV